MSKFHVLNYRNYGTTNHLKILCKTKTCFSKVSISSVIFAEIEL